MKSAKIAAVSYSTPQEFLQVAPRLGREGCILLDIRMPQMDGLILLQKLRSAGVQLPVIMMTAQGDVQTAVRAMKAGATDFIEKPFESDELIRAVKASLAQSPLTIPSLEVELAAARVAALTPRERAVLIALVAGRPNKVIAFELGLSVRTVEAHRARMMDRLGVRQISAAVKLAVLASLTRSGGGSGKSEPPISWGEDTGTGSLRIPPAPRDPISGCVGERSSR